MIVGNAEIFNQESSNKVFLPFLFENITPRIIKNNPIPANWIAEEMKTNELTDELEAYL
jgi:hypothetical protein